MKGNYFGRHDHADCLDDIAMAVLFHQIHHSAVGGSRAGCCFHGLYLLSGIDGVNSNRKKYL